MQPPVPPPPWLRGDVAGVLPVVSVWLRNLEEVLEIVDKWAADLGPAGFWWVPGPNTNPVGGLVRHIGIASVRLLYRGRGEEIPEPFQKLPPEQLRLTHEAPEAVLGEFRANMRLVWEGLSALREADLEAPRAWGRNPPVPAMYIFDHIGNHAQHHAGQIITTRKLWDATRI